MHKLMFASIRTHTHTHTWDSVTCNRQGSRTSRPITPPHSPVCVCVCVWLHGAISCNISFPLCLYLIPAFSLQRVCSLSLSFSLSVGFGVYEGKLQVIGHLSYYACERAHELQFWLVLLIFCLHLSWWCLALRALSVWLCVCVRIKGSG